MSSRSKICKIVLVGLTFSGAIACKRGSANNSQSKSKDSESSLEALATPEISIRQAGNHPTTYVVKVAEMTNELDSGFLLSMVGKDYESTKIEKTFNLKSNKLVLRTQAPWETVAVKKDFASDSLEFCGKLEAIKTDIQKAVEGDPVYFKAEPRLAPVADQLQKIYDSKCFQELSVRQPGNHPTTYVVKLANMSKELDSGFLLSMVGKDYTSTKIEKTFNFETSKLVLRTQAPWETAAVKNDFASDNPEYCSKLEAIKADIQNAVKGDPVYFKAEPRLAPVADQLQKIFDGKCKKS